MSKKTREKPRLVRFVSPFNSPAWMEPERAEQLCKEHDARWLRYQELGLLTEEQRAVGPPIIETHRE